MNAMSEIQASLHERLEAVRVRANQGGLPVRRKDGALYAVLADCFALCEEIIRDGLQEELKAAILSGVNGLRGARSVKPTSDAYTMVCRYALGNRDDFSSITKYSQALREAARLGIKPPDLRQWLGENGGTRALYLRSRAENPKNGTMRQVLHLNQRITFPREGTFTITLEHDGKGFFNVITEGTA